jgi:hypothetical protein
VCIKGDIGANRSGRAPTEAGLELLYEIDDSKESNNLSPTLYLYVGQRVSVTENVSTTLGAANGSQGVVVGFKHARIANDDDGAPSTELPGDPDQLQAVRLQAVVGADVDANNNTVEQQRSTIIILQRPRAAELPECVEHHDHPRQSNHQQQAQHQRHRRRR